MQMPPATNPRKRPAPSTSPVPQVQQMQQGYAQAAPPLPNDQFLRWNQSVDGRAYPNSATYNMGAYGSNSLANAQFEQPLPAQSTQIARRPMNRQLVSTASHTNYDNMNDPWGAFGDDSPLDSGNVNGAMEDNDSVERLEERAAVAKRDAQSKRKQIPPFVQKLSSFLDESKNTDLIRWSNRGDSFVVLDEDEFAKTLIPELFKHNNYASFVRQLNMYGFHKRVGLSDNSMKASERKNKSPSEYYNPYFKQGHPNLLWLINKPKSGSAQKKGKGTRVKTEDGGDGDSDEDAREGVEESYGGNYVQTPAQPVPRAISAVPESGPLQRREMTIVQNQLHEIQKQQSAISNAIARLRNDNTQLIQQAKAFQMLHDRHESSINAILTFLATVYNRSLDGQNGPNIAQMFANAMPQDQHHQGSVVDIGDIGDMGNQQQQNADNLSPQRRPQRLLMAPPSNGGRSTSATPTPMSQTSGGGGQNPPGELRTSNSPRPGAIEELFDSPSESAHLKSEMDPGQVHPQQNIMNLINNTNAQGARHGSNGMNFPEALSHYENSNGNSPLTSEQRSNMLNMIAGATPGGKSSHNALVSPTPSLQPTFDQLAFNQHELEELQRMQREQDAKLHDVSTLLQPLSPSGSIPGLDNNYFNAGDISPMGNSSNLDLDQFLDPSAFYSNGDSNDYNYDGFTGADVNGGYDFGLDGIGSDGPEAGNGGRIVDEGGSSDAATPAADEKLGTSTARSAGQAGSSKRLRKG